MADWESKEVVLPPKSMWRYAQPAPKLDAVAGGRGMLSEMAAAAVAAAKARAKAAAAAAADGKVVLSVPPPSLKAREMWKNDSGKDAEKQGSSDSSGKWSPGGMAGTAARDKLVTTPAKVKVKVLASPQVVKPPGSLRQVLVPWPKVGNEGSRQPHDPPPGCTASPLVEVKSQVSQSGTRLPLVVIRSSLPTAVPKETATPTILPVAKNLKGSTCTVYIDELDMPERPEIEPSPTEKEVWVDPLPDEAELTEWLKAFGDVKEVFRIPDPDTGLPTERGYVLFKAHDIAKKCVETGAGTWSESERALASQTSYRRMTIRSYPESVVSAFLGKKGEEILNLRRAAGVWKLAVKPKKGADLALKKGQDEEASTSTRLHFWAEGPEEAMERVKPELERRLAEIHQMIKKTLEELGETWKAEQRELVAARKQSRKRRTRHRDGERNKRQKVQGTPAEGVEEPEQQEPPQEPEQEDEDDDHSKEGEGDKDGDWFNSAAGSRATYGQCDADGGWEDPRVHGGRERGGRDEYRPYEEFHGLPPPGHPPVHGHYPAFGGFVPGQEPPPFWDGAGGPGGGFYGGPPPVVGQIPPPPHDGAPPPGWGGWGPPPGQWMQPPPPPTGPPPPGTVEAGLGPLNARPTSAPHLQEDEDDN